MSENNLPATIAPNENENDKALELAKSRIGSEVIDDETGETVQLSQDDYNEFITAQQDMKAGALNAALGKIQFARGLLKIKNKKLYLFCSESFTDYAKNNLQISRSKAYDFTRLAEKLGQSPAFGKIMELPFATALELARDTDFVDQVNSENSDVADQVLNSKAAELNEKLKALRTKAKTSNDEVKSLTKTINDNRENFDGLKNHYELEIQKLKDMVDVMATERGIDPERLRQIKSKQDLLTGITETGMFLGKHLTKIVDAAEIDELRDAEIGNSINRLIDILQDWINSLHSAYADVLFPLTKKRGYSQSEDEESDVPA